MLFQIKNIKFDFTGCLETQGTYELPEEEQKMIIDVVMSQMWEAEDGDDLVEKITSATGWSVETIDYQ